MIASMSEMDVKALNANFKIWIEERAVGLKPSKAFERYVFEQVLKDHDPADEDLDLGDLGEGGDGGIDGMYLYMGGQLIGEETPAPQAASDVELHVIQAKFENGFKETTVEKMEAFARDQNIDIFGVSPKTVRKQRHAAYDRIRNAQLVKLVSNAGQAFLDFSTTFEEETTLSHRPLQVL